MFVVRRVANTGLIHVSERNLCCALREHPVLLCEGYLVERSTFESFIFNLDWKPDT